MKKDKYYWKFKIKKTKEKYQEYRRYIFSTSTFFRCSLTVLILSVFFVLFFTCGGMLYFYDVVIVDAFKGVDFQIHAISVGQGDSTLIKFPNNQTMLIDAGERDQGEHVTNYIKAFLRQEGLDCLDFLVLTHPDSDHIGGAINVLENINVKNVFRPKVYTEEEASNLDGENISISTTATYHELVDLISEKQCDVIFTDNTINMNLGGVRVEFLSPSEDYYSDTNEYSAVIMFTYQTKKFLFMGDANSEIEHTLIENYGDYLNADVLKVAHHGSNTSSSAEFLNVVKPKYALLYVAGNKDLPSVDVLNRLHEIGSDLLQTSLLGDYAMTIANDDILISQAPTPTIDIALLISISTLLVIATWGINNPFSQKYNPRRVPPKILED